jgi:alkylhydroperoxidase family enzyme
MTSRIENGKRARPMVLPKKIQNTIEALLAPSGKSDPALRVAVFERTRKSAGEIPSALCELVEKIDQRPWRVSDADFSKLRQAGYSEDQLFELTVAAAAGAGVKRFEAGLRAIKAAVNDGGGY